MQDKHLLYGVLGEMQKEGEGAVPSLSTFFIRPEGGDRFS